MLMLQMLNNHKLWMCNSFHCVQLLGATGQDTNVAETEGRSDRVMEENKVLKLQYENAVEVVGHYIEMLLL